MSLQHWDQSVNPNVRANSLPDTVLPRFKFRSASSNDFRCTFVGENSFIFLNSSKASYSFRGTITKSPFLVIFLGMVMASIMRMVSFSRLNYKYYFPYDASYISFSIHPQFSLLPLIIGVAMISGSS